MNEPNESFGQSNTAPLQHALMVVGKMWADLVAWSRNWMLIEGSELAGELDLKIPVCANTIEEALAGSVLRPNSRLPLARNKTNVP